MLKNYIKIAWRNMLRQKLYSLITIGGLTAGLFVCMLIMLYIAHENSFDRFHVNAKKLFVLDEHVKIGGNNMQFAYTNFVTGPLIKQNAGGVDNYMRTRLFNDEMIVSAFQSPSDKFLEGHVLFADAGFFKFFSFNLLRGTPLQVLSKPNSVVISRNMAKKYFGETDPIGKTLIIGIDSMAVFEVTGIAENAPSNSSVVYDFVIPIAGIKAIPQSHSDSKSPYIGSGEYETYLQLRSAADTVNVNHTMQALFKLDKSAIGATMRLTAFPDMHFKSNYDDYSNINILKYSHW